jgi:hypothetical protein
MTVHFQVSRFIVSSALGPNLAGPDLAAGGSEPDPITPGAAPGAATKLDFFRTGPDSESRPNLLYDLRPSQVQ